MYLNLRSIQTFCKGNYRFKDFMLISNWKKNVEALLVKFLYV